MKRLGQVLWIAAALTLAPVNVTFAQSAEQIEEQRALDVVKAISAGDPDALLVRMQENWVPAEEGSDRDNRWPQFVSTVTGLEKGNVVTDVEATQPHALTVITQRPGGEVISFLFEFESEPPYRVTRMGVEADAGERGAAVDLPPFELAPDADKLAIVDALDDWFSQLADDDIFSGTALVAWKGKTVFSGAWGLASQDWNIPNRIDTRFDLGSINKSFTQIAIGRLAAQGKLGFGDRLADRLPDYPNKDVAARITIRQLLDHTSGLGDIFTDDFFNSSKTLYRRPRDFFPLFADQPLLFEPGSKSHYSNAGYMVLGVIIEEVSGQPYDEYVEQNIFEPAGMTTAGFFAHDAIVPDLAVGYTRMGPDGDSDTRHNNLFMLPVKGNSAGSAQATVEDLLNFDNALREYRLLTPAYTQWYFGGKEPPSTVTTASVPPRSTAGTGIAGGAPGVSADLESDGILTVIVLSNYDAPIAEDVAQTIYRPLYRAFQNAAE